MKLKTSVTLSREILKAVALVTPKGGSRSQTIEGLLRESLSGRARRARDRKDLEIINQHAELLNEEAEDVLTYQAEL